MVFALAAFGCSGHNQDYEQLYVGFNGTRFAKTSVFASSSDVSKSWVHSAIPRDVLDSILSRVDFEKQMLLVAAIGKRETATGIVTIARIVLTGSTLVPYIRIEVNGANCNEPHAESYPYVLAAVTRSSSLPVLPGLDHFNVPNGCKPVKAGAPID